MHAERQVAILQVPSKVGGAACMAPSIVILSTPQDGGDLQRLLFTHLACVFVEAACTWAQHPRTSKSGKPSSHVHDTAASKVHNASAEQEVISEGRSPAR